MPFDMSDSSAKLAICLPRRALFACFLVCARGATASSAAQSVLAESDAIRNPSKPFSVTIQLLEYRNSKLVDSNTLEVFIRRLRKKIDPDETLNPIETLRGRGYRFAL